MKHIITTACMLTLLLTGMTLAQIEQAKPQAALAMKAEVQICKSVADRNPVDVVTIAGTDVGQLYCWCKVNGGSGDQSITHVWSYGGKVVAEVPLTIRGSSWRTWSAKKIAPSMTGQWEVKVVDASGNTLTTATFTIGEEKK